MWNNVHEFKDWWAQNRPFAPPFHNFSYITDLAYSMCLYRAGQFQVELYVLKPNSTSPQHGHPGVDSVFIYLGGYLEFGKEDGTFENLLSAQQAKPDGTHLLFGAQAEAMDGASHAVRTFDGYAAFLSFEHWKTKPPDSVVINWEGAPDGEKHQGIWDSNTKTE